MIFRLTILYQYCLLNQLIFMCSYLKQEFQEVSMFLHFVKTQLPESLNTYPVFKIDEEGEQIVIEINHDKAGNREILLTIYIDVDTRINSDFGQFIGNNEVLLTVTNNAQLIGLMNIVILALGTQVKTALPIDEDGHFSPF